MSWATAFLLTLALEAPVYAAGLGGACRRRRDLLLMILVLNAATHPALWAWCSKVRPGLAGLAAAEAAVAVVEGLLAFALLRRSGSGGAGLPRALAVAASANAFSWGAGLVLWRLVQRW